MASFRPISDIVIHCTATPNGKPLTLKDIDGMHERVGFRRTMTFREKFNYWVKHAGYHGVIYPSGMYVTGRHFDEWGAHVKGSNARSIGFAMVGTDRYTKAQWFTLRSLVVQTVRYLADRDVAFRARRSNFEVETPEAVLVYMRASGLRINGHRDYSPDLNGDGVIDRTDWFKTCPGFSVKDWLYGRASMLPEVSRVIDGAA